MPACQKKYALAGSAPHSASFHLRQRPAAVREEEWTRNLMLEDDGVIGREGSKEEENHYRIHAGQLRTYLLVLVW